MKTLLLACLTPLYIFAQTPMLPDTRPADLQVFFSSIREAPFEDIRLQVCGRRAVWNRTAARSEPTHGERQLTDEDLDHLYALLKRHHADKMRGNPVKGPAASLQIGWDDGRSQILLLNLDEHAVAEPYRPDWKALVQRLRVLHRWTEGEK